VQAAQSSLLKEQHMRLYLRLTGALILSAVISGALATTGARAQGKKPRFRFEKTWKVEAIEASVEVNIIPYGNVTSANYVYGTKPNLDGALKTKPKRIDPRDYDSWLRRKLINLKPGTTYYWQAVAVNSGGTTKTAIYSFKTWSVGPPSVGKIWHWHVKSTTAGLSMNAYGVAVRSKAHFLYGTDPNLAGAMRTRPDSAGPSNIGSGSHATLKNLKPGTTYYYQAFVSNAYGSAKSKIGSFKTK
jgi:hypothetical protein